MSDLIALASMRQENLITLRTTIEAVKQEAKADGSTRTIARALDLIELVLRAQEERLKAMDAVAAALEAKGRKGPIAFSSGSRRGPADDRGRAGDGAAGVGAR